MIDYIDYSKISIAKKGFCIYQQCYKNSQHYYRFGNRVIEYCNKHDGRSLSVQSGSARKLSIDDYLLIINMIQIQSVMSG